MTRTPTENNTSATTESGDFAALATLAGLTGTTSDQMRLLKIITNPVNSNGSRDGSTHLEIADDWEANMGDYFSGDWEYAVGTVADFLYTHYQNDDTTPDFFFGWNASPGGEMGSYDVSINIGQWPNDFYMSENGDIKNSTEDRTAAGLASAIAVATTLDAHYQSLVAKARRFGLLPAPDDIINGAVAALTALDAAMGTPEGVNAATAAQARASLAALISAQRGPEQPTR